MLFRSIEPEEFPEMERQVAPKIERLLTIPDLARSLPIQSVSHPLAVTQWGLGYKPGEERFSDLQPAVWTGGDADSASRAPGYLVGEMVHRALAHWQCLAYADHELTRYLERLAHRQGIDSQALEHAVRTSYHMLGRLKRHKLYATIQKAVQQYREIPFTLETRQGTLRGVIDLLYQDAYGNWRLLDWKTEWTPEEKLAEHAQEHRLQMAVYAKAVEMQLGVLPQVELCFLSPKVRNTRLGYDVIADL